MANIDAKDTGTDGHLLEEVMDDDGHTGNTAGGKVCTYCKRINTDGIKNAAHNVEQQIGPKVFFNIILYVIQ